MQEGHMANCLEIAFKHNIPKQQRKARVAKSPDWQIMDKSWRSILTIALDEVEIPGDDEDNSTSRSSRMMRRRGRGSSAGKSSLDWLPSSEEITSDSSETAAYRLAVLLINKQLKRGEWTDDLSAAENAMRETCLTNGVDKVWHQIGEKTPLLAQFIGFPVAKKKAKTKKKVSLSVAKVDVFDNEQLGQAISQLSLLCGDAAQQIAIQKIQSQISSRRSIEAGESLLSPYR